MVAKREQGHGLSRRAVLAGLPLFTAACATGTRGFDRWTPITPDDARYGSIVDGAITIPALDLSATEASLLRQDVAWRGPERPGSIVIAIAERRLYLITGGGRALRYAVGVGRAEALNFQGSAVIGRKEQWPRWTPTASMINQIPRYAAYVGGLPGGLDNPLGARALYLYRGNQDTYFRVHGTNEPASIGTAASSGCIRLFNQDIIDLYNRVPMGTSVTVRQN
jgi:lipoprotein-anchoring transpeptidase ErfK/SrfK